MKKINPAQSPFAAGLAVLVLLLIVGGGVLTLSQLQKQQNNQSKASLLTVQWDVAQSATAACIPAGTVNISVSFTNQEASKGINVVAEDSQTGDSVNIGTINAGATKTGVITTSKTSLNSGQVTFTMKWSSGASGTDTRTASYSKVSQCPKPTATPAPKPTPTITPYYPTPTVAPTLKPTATPTPIYYTPVTPTPTACPTPGVVKNIKITCPYCTPTPSP